MSPRAEVPLHRRTEPIDGRVDGGAHVSGNGSGDRAVRASPAPTDGRSIPELIRTLSNESSTLLRNEVDLAKAEMREKIGVFQESMVSIAVGGALLMGALLTGLWAVNRGLTALLTLFMGLEVAVWLSPLILTVALAAIGWGMIKGGRERMRREGVMPERTARTLRRDGRWAQEKAQHIKEEVTHG